MDDDALDIPGISRRRVHPNFTYARVRVKRGPVEEALVLLEEKVEELRTTAGIEELKVLETLKGADLIGLHYRHPLSTWCRIRSRSAGNGCTRSWLRHGHEREHGHSAHRPWARPRGFRHRDRHDLEPFSPVDESGEYTDEAATTTRACT